MNASRLAGRAAVVTGGGRGIGAAVARELARAGAAVLVAARTRSQVDAVAASLAAEGAAAFAERCDVTEPAGVQGLATRAIQRLGKVDILVNSAGRAHSAPVHKITLDEWNDLFRTNATSAFLCTQAFLPGMLERGWGRVVTIASIAGLQGAKYIAAYAASKHAVVGFTRSVAADVAERGVTVNAVCPGYVDTDMTAESIERILQHTGMSRERALEAILSTTPQHRLITPEEVAHAVLSLCVEEARGITGETVVLGGGALLT